MYATRRRKGRSRRGLSPSLHLEIWYFPIIFLAKKVVYLVSSGKNEISPFLPTLRKSLASPGKFHYCLLPVHNVWLIMDNWWTTVLWSGSTELCNRFRKHFRSFALKYFFGLHIKSLIDLKIFCETFEIGGEIAPIAPPGYVPAQTFGRSSGYFIHVF